MAKSYEVSVEGKYGQIEERLEALAGLHKGKHVGQGVLIPTMVRDVQYEFSTKRGAMAFLREAAKILGVTKVGCDLL